MRFIFLLLLIIFSYCTPHALGAQETKSEVVVGAARIDRYAAQLKGKRIGMVVNHTSTIGSTHLVDSLSSMGLRLEVIFAPEHGFRGKADAGEQVKDGRDTKTGLPIISLYGDNKKPTVAQISQCEVVIFDIQDVGARFYTYISTMHYVMEACAEQSVQMLILDRPNPNGHYIDGPVLDPRFQSFVGKHQIPVVHGLTVGELARMIKGEKWINRAENLDLSVIKCLNYTHETHYELPIKPSPNLPNMRSIYLYPSLCFFEGTEISVGRGTDKQFQVIGSPKLPGGKYQFTPKSGPGAKYPKHENKVCYGEDLSKFSVESLASQSCLNLSFLVESYKRYPDKSKFFLKNLFIDKLAGTDKLRKQIQKGLNEEQIRLSWKSDHEQYRKMRAAYLLYPDFDHVNE